MFDNSAMAAAKGKDSGALATTNGALSSLSSNVQTRVSGLFCLSPDRLHSNRLPSDSTHSNRLPSDRLHDNQLPSDWTHSNRLPSDRLDDNRLPGDVDLLDDDNDDDDLSGLSNSYTETEQQVLDEFAQRFSEELGGTFDGSTTMTQESTSFDLQDSPSVEMNNGSPESQSNFEGVSSNVPTKVKGAGRAKGRPAKASSGGSMNRTVIQCPTCRKTFNNSSALAKHKLIHSDERKYTCSLCSKAFKRQDHLNGHLMTHCSKKPYECKFIGCDKSYCDARSLRRHHENHHQQLLDGSTANGSEASLTPGLTPAGLTPGLTPGASGDTQSGVFRFDLPFQALCSAQDGPRSDADGSPLAGQDTSPMSPGVSASPTMVTQKTAAWASGFNPLNEPRPVRCTICDRRFRNMPALNGHMRLHGGYLKKDAMEVDRTDDIFNGPDQNIVVIGQEMDQSPSFSVPSGAGQLSAASSSSSTLSACDPVFSPREVVVPKQEGNFADIFDPSNDISLSLVVESLSGNQSTVTEFLQRLARPTAQNQDALHEQQQLMDTVNRLHLVEEVQQLNFGRGWTDAERGVGRAPPDGSASGPGDEKMQFVQQGQIQRLMTAASQLSIDAASKASASDSSAIYDQLSATGLVNHGFTLGVSVNSPAVPINPPSTPTINKCHLVVNRSQPMTPSYAVVHEPALHRSASTVYSGSTQTPHTPLSPFIVKTLYPQPPNSTPTFFQFPSRPTNPPKDGLIPSHPSTPNLLFYGTHAPPRSPFTPQSKTPYTPNTPRHFQFPPTSGVLDASSSNAGSPYPHHFPKSYHPYSRPTPQSPRYVHQTVTPAQHHPDAAEQKRQEAIMQVEQKIDEHIQLLQQEDLKKQQQQVALQVVRNHSDLDGKDFSAPLFDSVFGDAANPASEAAIDIRDLFGLDSIRESGGPFDMDLGLPVGCPDLDAFNPISSGDDLSVLLDNGGDNAKQPPTLTSVDLDPDVDVPDEVIQLLQEQFGDIISGELADIDDMTSSVATVTVGMSTVPVSTVTMETYASIGFVSTTPMTFIQGPSPTTTLSVSSVPPAFRVLSAQSSRAEEAFSCPPEPGKKGRKHRPEPLYIPSNVNNYGFASQLRSPRLWDSSRKRATMPYTPPPMISPARKGSGVFWAMSSTRVVPQSAPPFNHGSTDREPVRYTFDELPTEANDEPPPTDILPHVNIGPEFQAEIPAVAADEVEPVDEKHIDGTEVLVWDPKTVEGLTEDELRQYQEFACCASRPGNGTNKEEALHLLQMCNGSTKMAILKLVQGHVKPPKLNGNNGFLCHESDSWKEDEIEKYHRALLISDKDFTEIAKEVGTKSVKQCIQFYYIWKKICSDEYRALCQRRLLGTDTYSLVADAGRGQMVIDGPAGHRSSDHGL